VQSKVTDPRVRVIVHERNRGVGGAVITGYRRALADGADVIVKVDGDGQMDPALIPRFVQPLRRGLADYTKGNRFFRLEDVAGMPATRLIGNAVLSFLSKLSTGYWRVFDPTNGYTAVDARVLNLVPLEKLAQGYFFESDLLFRLNTVRAVVLDIPIKAHYGAPSSLRVLRELPVFAWKHAVNFLKRIGYNYFLRDFNVASLQWLLAPPLIVFGLTFGAHAWLASIESGIEATAGTVMLAALPLILGIQLLLSALHFDIDNRPSVPLHVLLDDAG
jgi:glycosyltransferase involved in cell wall biosynthesis